MPAELNEEAVCSVITEALKAANGSDSLSNPVTILSMMGSPREWDSLSFVSVFTAVGQAFDVELDDDDAIHFQTAQGIHDFLTDILSE